jgi:hypothetical protein
MAVIAVDFDDTLMDTNNVLPGYRMGQPTPGAILSMSRLANEGHQCIIFTARNVQDPRAYKAVEDWLNHFQIPHHGITNIKRPEMQIFIDDRAMAFDSWPQVMARINKQTQQENIVD